MHNDIPISPQALAEQERTALADKIEKAVAGETYENVVSAIGLVLFRSGFKEGVMQGGDIVVVQATSEQILSLLSEEADFPDDEDELPSTSPTKANLIN